MALAPLATADDVEARLGRSLTADEAERIDAVIADASAKVRNYTGQQFTRETTTDRFRVRRGIVKLPQRPVIAVSSVISVLSGQPTFFRWDGIDRVSFLMSELDEFEWNPVRLAPHPPAVEITYTHGYDELPDDIVGVVCSIVTRTLGRRPEDSAVSQESIAGYSYSIGSAGAAGGFGLLPDERATLDGYKGAGGWVDVTGAS